MKAKAALLLIVALLTACSKVDERERLAMQHNDQAYRLRYSDVAASLQAAEKALASGNSSSRYEALNNMAYVAYQQMRYDQALHLLQKVYGGSHNQLELLCADVLSMKVMQRIGQGKSFFDVRLRAQKRLRLILSEEENLTERQRHRLHYALSELHIVASTYYYYLGQDSAARREIHEAEQYVNLESDTTQWLYYHYMLGSGGLVEGSPEEVTVAEFGHLFRVYTLAKGHGFTYFEANALQSLAAMIADSLQATTVIRQRSDAYSYLYGEHQDWQKDSLLSVRHQFAAALSHHSIALFQKYRDLFQTANAFRTLGEVYFSAGQYMQALGSFRKALHLTSDHKRSPYQVTPWLAGIHENLSLTYSALGNKAQADIHRNTYLDLLDVSRQNRELDSRKALLKQEAHSELVQFLLLLLLAATVAILSAIYYRQVKRRSLSSEQKVRQIASSEASVQVSRKLNQLLQDSKERLEDSKEECLAEQQRILQQQERHILGRTKLSVVYAVIPYLDRVIAEAKKLDGMDENASQRLAYIQELCSGVMSINESLTSWIQMQRGKLSLKVSRFPLCDVLQVISMQQSAFAQQQLTLEVPETELVVKADKPLTLFMVNTLVDNARKFTPANGKVYISLDETDDYVEVSVCDTGIGLSPEDVRTLNDSKVYDPQQIGSQHIGKGFGFGIMNCKGIINSYRKLSSLFRVCDFGVESEQGRGSRFWFRLPRVLNVLFLVLSTVSVGAMPQRCFELYDSIFAANLQGRYADACLYADSALSQVGEPIDTPLLVSLYNEQAIAAQALRQWDVYRQSNAECVRLHRLYSTDSSLASDCQQLEKMTADSRVLYFLIVLLLLASLVLFYRVVLRHRLRHRASLDDLYQRLTAVLASFPENAATMEGELQAIVRSLEQPQLRQPVEELRQALSSGLTAWRETTANLEEAGDKAQRLRFEHDRLYVMNQILDNSLSTIKHETMYFPSRIKQMADDMQANGVSDAARRNLLDLVSYYRHIYMLFYEQAQRQTEQAPLRMQTVAVSSLFSYAEMQGVACRPTNVRVEGDEGRLRLLIDQLIAVMSVNALLEVEQRDNIYYIMCSAEGRSFAPQELTELFLPQTKRLECLVMREIVREHDAALGHPGLRLVAENTERGCRIAFSLLPAQQ